VINVNPEPPVLSTDDAKDLGNWVHLHPNILKIGRCTPLPKEGGEEGQEEAEGGDDPVHDRFRSLGADDYNHIPGYEPAFSWIAKVAGDLQPYNKAGEEGTVTYAVNVVKNMRWPGALTVAKNGKYCSIYVGDGIKRGGDPSYFPTEPPEV